MDSLWLLLKKFDTWAFGQIDYIEKLWPRIMIDLRSCKNIHCMVFLSSFLKNTHRLDCWEQNPGHRRAYLREVVWGSQRCGTLRLPAFSPVNILCEFLTHFLYVAVFKQARWSVVQRYLIQKVTLFKLSVIKELEWSVLGTLGNALQRCVFDWHLRERVQASPGRKACQFGQWMYKQRV